MFSCTIFFIGESAKFNYCYTLIFYCLKNISNSRVIAGISNLEQFEQLVNWLPLLKDDIILEMNEITKKFSNLLILEPTTYFEKSFKLNDL